MRAGRLLTMVVTLQRNGRMTARQLADQLEVTPRTVLRDVDALSEAGVPIYTVQGQGGGIELLEGFATRLTTLTADAAAGLLLAGGPGLAAALGLGAAAASARRTVLQALPPELAQRAAALDAWFLHDPGPDAVAGVPGTVTRQLAIALRAGCQALLRGPDGDEPVAPLGLVLGADGWHLVHLTSRGPAVRRLAGVTAADVVQRPVERPPGFDLADTWQALRSPGPAQDQPRAHSRVGSR
jgi:predicted DNA-binding transcriptional regulator YafY